MENTEKKQRKIISVGTLFMQINSDKVGIYAAQASFFIILSIFPFLLLFLNIVGITSSFEPSSLISVINTYAPETIRPLVAQIIRELYEHVSGTTISIAAIVAIWSASKGVLSVMFGLYEIYNPHRRRNYLISRFISMIYTVLFVLTITLTMTLLVFGNKLFNLAISLIPALKDITILSLILRYLVSFLVLSLFFAIIYRIATFKLSKFKKVFPGALFSALGWIVFSYGFSIYVDNFSNMSYMYGSLTAFIILMLWIYFCIYILFIGAEINKLLYPDIEAGNKQFPAA